jgi:hypothetical protein
MPLEKGFEDFTGTPAQAFEKLANQVPEVQAKLSAIEQRMLALAKNPTAGGIKDLTLEMIELNIYYEALDHNISNTIGAILKVILTEVVSRGNDPKRN